MSPDWLMNYYWRMQREGFYELELSDLYSYANDPEALLNQLDKRFTRGQLTSRTRRLIKYNIDRNLNTKNRINSAIGILLLSPEYNILK
jgi:hypothetical protein